MKILQALPLFIFLGFLRTIDTQVPENWKMPFVVSGSAAIVVIIISSYRKSIFDRILLGFNLYFISGGFALIAQQWWLSRFYDQLQASGLLLWVIATGIATTVFSSNGFIGVESADAKLIKKYSYYLLLFSIIAFSLSLYSQGNRLFSELIPFIGIFLIQNVLKKKLIDNVPDRQNEPSNADSIDT